MEEVNYRAAERRGFWEPGPRAGTDAFIPAASGGVFSGIFIKMAATILTAPKIMCEGCAQTITQALAQDKGRGQAFAPQGSEMKGSPGQAPAAGKSLPLPHETYPANLGIGQ